MNLEDIWQSFLSKIQKKLSPFTFRCFIKDLKIYSYNGNKMIICIPSNNERLLNSIIQYYSSIIQEVMDDVTNSSCEIEYVLEKMSCTINLIKE